MGAYGYVSPALPNRYKRCTKPVHNLSQIGAKFVQNLYKLCSKSVANVYKIVTQDAPQAHKCKVCV